MLFQYENNMAKGEAHKKPKDTIWICLSVELTGGWLTIYMYTEYNWIQLLHILNYTCMIAAMLFKLETDFAKVANNWRIK